MNNSFSTTKSTPTSIVCSEMCINVIKLMSFMTVSFSRINRGRVITSHYIYCASNCLKVFRIYTAFVIAQMIDFKIFRYNSFMKLIRKSVCQYKFILKPELPVSAFFKTGRYSKHPAFGSFFNFAPKSFDWINLQRHS